MVGYSADQTGNESSWGVGGGGEEREEEAEEVGL